MAPNCCLHFRNEEKLGIGRTIPAVNAQLDGYLLREVGRALLAKSLCFLPLLLLWYPTPLPLGTSTETVLPFHT
jgi:hypothetical protein